MHVYRNCVDPRHKLGGGIHAYALTPDEVTVPQGYPHGDAWTRIAHPEAPPTHDVERYLEALAKKKERS